MIDAIDELIVAARKAAKSQYTRTAKKAQWTRLAGQLIWYKDQILRAMTYEALEADVHMLMRKVFEEDEKHITPSYQHLEFSKNPVLPDSETFRERNRGDAKPGEPEDASAAASGQSR